MMAIIPSLLNAGVEKNNHVDCEELLTSATELGAMVATGIVCYGLR